jgi:hypothetical protein
MIFDWPQDPTWAPMSGTFRVRSIAEISTSPYTGGIKSRSLGQIWVAKLQWNNHSLDDGQDIQNFLNQLEGSTNPVRLFDWWRSAPSLLSGGSQPWSDGTYFSDGTGWTDGWAPSLIADAARGDAVVVVTGLPASTACFKRGDLIGLDGYLYEIKSEVTANSAGQAAVNFLPVLRMGLASGDMVNMYRPTVPMRLVSDADAEINRAIKWSEPFSLTFVEDLP